MQTKICHAGCRQRPIATYEYWWSHDECYDYSSLCTYVTLQVNHCT